MGTEEKTDVGLSVGDELQIEEFGLLLEMKSVNGRGAVLSFRFKDGSKAYSEELDAGRYVLTKKAGGSAGCVRFSGGSPSPSGERL